LPRRWRWTRSKAKRVAAAAGVPIAESTGGQPLRFPNKHPMKPPYVVKPVREGSSFGVVIVTEDQAHPPQVVSSPEWHYGEEVIVERYIHGRELTCGVMGETPLGVTEVVPLGHNFYDYDSKYAPAVQNTSSLRKFHRIFTKKYKHWH
jgi:D-alanine-D-alanine ligase